MKDFAYYTKVDLEYPNRFKYRDSLIESVNNTPMTADERKKELAEVPKRTSKWFSEMVKPYNEAMRKLADEFWTDAREELEYDSYLNEEGVKLLESMAYEEGHAHGFSNIYNKLVDLEEFAEKLIKRGRQHE